MKYTIVLDAGHGGKDPGAVGNGLREKDLTLSMALKVEKELKRMYGDQVNVKQTRNKDVYLTLTERKNKGNTIPFTVENGKRVYQGVLVSFHKNSASTKSAKGWEIFSTHKKSMGTALAKSIEKEVQPYISTNRGVKHAMFTVITCNPPSALIETAFISSTSDMELYMKNENQLAKAYAKGIGNYLKLKEVEPVKEKEHWAEQYFQNLNNKGITVSERRFDDPITRGELFALLDRATNGDAGKKYYNIQRNKQYTAITVPKEYVASLDVVTATNNSNLQKLQTIHDNNGFDITVNGGLFWYDSKTAKAHSLNLLIENHIQHNEGIYSRFGLRVFDSGEYEMAQYKWDRHLKHMIGGSPALIVDGVISIDHYLDKARHPRTAIGLTKNDDIVIVAINGRNPKENVNGMTIDEVAKLMKSLNCHHAINLDGGGSTRLICENNVVNSPTENRAIHSAIGIKLKK